MNQIGLMIAFFALIYFMMIRPQQKQQKQRKEMLDSLRLGDRIITIGGIEGLIQELRETKVVVKIADDVNVVLLKTAIGQVVEEEEIEEIEALNEKNETIEIEEEE